MGRKIISLVILALFVFSMTPILSCGNHEEAIQVEIKRLKARNEIQNLMGRYAYFHASGLNFMAAEKLFTTYDDTVIEMMWGRYTGKDAAYRCYVVGHRNDDQPTIDALKIDIPPLTPEQQAMIVRAPQGITDETVSQGAPATKTSPGAFSSGPASKRGMPISDQAITAPSDGFTKDALPPLHIKALTTPVIEVAGDGETARAVWISPGMEGTEPAWVKFGCDFKKQDDEWRIWHLHVYGLMTGLESRDTFTPKTEPSNGADRAPTTSWEYSKEATYIPYQPQPPQPYETWDYATIQPKSYGDPN